VETPQFFGIGQKAPLLDKKENDYKKPELKLPKGKGEKKSP